MQVSSDLKMQMVILIKLQWCNSLIDAVLNYSRYKGSLINSKSCQYTYTYSDDKFTKQNTNKINLNIAQLVLVCQLN